MELSSDLTSPSLPLLLSLFLSPSLFLAFSLSPSLSLSLSLYLFLSLPLPTSPSSYLSLSLSPSLPLFGCCWNVVDFCHKITPSGFQQDRVAPSRLVVVRRSLVLFFKNYFSLFQRNESNLKAQLNLL